VSETDADWRDGILRSRRFDDIYFSRDGGLAETQAVFLAGCGLPERWQARQQFTVAELGFGTGLNVLALLDLWQRTRPASGHLHVFSVEGYPLARADLARALAEWPQFAALSQPILERWPGATPGFHRIDWPALGATLDLAIQEVEAALNAWQGKADAWFLDGFAPARNPEMWRDAVLAQVAARSAPGARLATYTVAGAVRSGLAAQGFTVARQPGFGRKRARLEAHWPGDRIEPAMPRVAIVGAGIAGAALARAFAALGVPATVFDAGPMASGNPAALISPRLIAGDGPEAHLCAQAFRRSVELIAATAPQAILARGLVRLERTPKDSARFDRIARDHVLGADALARLSPAAASAQLGEPVAVGGFAVPSALTVDPAVLRAAWLPENVEEAPVERLEQGEHGWRVVTAAGAEVFAIVCVAGGFAAKALWPLPLEPMRGQVSFAARAAPVPAAAWGGYVVPARDGVLFGATHDRGDTGSDERANDHARNRATLAAVLPGLAARLDDVPFTGQAGVRASTPDRQPIAGLLAPGLYALTGLGGRGFLFAPLLAEHVAALALGAPSPVPRPAAALVDPMRWTPGPASPM